MVDARSLATQGAAAPRRRARPAALRPRARSRARVPDRIHVRGLAARAIVGVNPEERTHRQDVLIDLELEYANAAGRSDRLADATDYKVVKRRVLEFVEESSFRLLEALAEGIADLCLDAPGVTGVRVVVDKPGALRFAQSVAVEIQRP